MQPLQQESNWTPTMSRAPVATAAKEMPSDVLVVPVVENQHGILMKIPIK